MNHSRLIRRPKAPAVGTTAGEKSSPGKARWIISLIIVLLLAVGAWAFLPSKDPALARIESLRSQIDGAPEGQRRELFGQMRQEFENLRPESREQLRDQFRQRWEQREQKFLNDFFAKTPQDQIAAIDKQLDDEQRREKERQQRRAQGGDRRGRGGPGNAQRGRGRGDSLERRKSYLDRTSPQTRAQRSEYRRMRDERRRERGLPPSRGWR
jgi:hypothetical protein